MNPSATCAEIRRLSRSIADHRDEARCWAGQKRADELEMLDIVALRLFRLRAACDKLRWRKCAALATAGLVGTSFHHRGDY
jgi:hypothetical protein